MANSKNYDIELRTSSTDAVPSALIGDKYWCDTGTTLNGEKVLYDNASSGYARWTHGTEGEVITLVGDVGESVLTDFFKLQDYPDTITVSGTGTDADRSYTLRDGLVSGNYAWDDEFLNPAIYWATSSWRLDRGGEYWINSGGYQAVPQKTGWNISNLSSPAPVLAYTIPENQLVGQGAFSGTITTSGNVIADAWCRAETTAFESLRNYTGCEENDNCFRGFLPVQGDGDDYKLANIWQMSSGDSGEFEIDRLAGDNPLWCSLRSDMRIESIWEDRCDAMKFAGLVTAWLKETNNLAETGNVTQCRLLDIPSEPVIYRTNGKIRKRLWLQTVQLELIYATENVYD